MYLKYLVNFEKDGIQTKTKKQLVAGHDLKELYDKCDDSIKILIKEKMDDDFETHLDTIIYAFTDMFQNFYESGTAVLGSKPSCFNIWRSRFLAFLRFQLFHLRSIFMHLAISRMLWTDIVLSSNDLTAEIIF